jgi:hypothetical protein
VVLVPDADAPVAELAGALAVPAPVAVGEVVAGLDAGCCELACCA